MNSFAAKYGKVAARAVELVLCTAVAAALCYTVQGGFNVSDAVHGAVWLDVLVCLVLQGMLLAGSFAGRGKIASLVAYVIASIVACVIAIVVAPTANPIADVPENPFIVTAVFVVTNLIVHLFTRRHGGCLALFALGAFICGFTQFMYTTNMLVATVAFIVSCGMLIVFRGYADTVDEAAPERYPLLGKATIVGTVVPLVTCALASAVVIGVIMPLDPPHAEIKLQNEYLSYEEDRVKTAVVLDEDAEKKITSSTVDDSLAPRTTTDKKIDPDAPQRVDPEGAQRQDKKDYLSGEYSDVDLNGLIENMQSLALDPPVPWALIIACILALIILLLTLPRYLVHRVRLRRIAARSPREQVELLYRFFLGRFKKLGIEKPPSLSPIEFANQFRRRLAPYVGAQGAGTFDHLTTLVVQQEYAGEDPSDDDLQSMYWLYWEFYRRCRKELGLFKYVFRKPTL